VNYCIYLDLIKNHVTLNQNKKENAYITVCMYKMMRQKQGINNVKIILIVKYVIEICY